MNHLEDVLFILTKHIAFEISWYLILWQLQEVVSISENTTDLFWENFHENIFTTKVHSWPIMTRHHKQIYSAPKNMVSLLFGGWILEFVMTSSRVFMIGWSWINE